MEVAEVAAAIAGGSDDSEVIADQLTRIADAAETLLSSGLSDRALIILLRDRSGVRQDDIRAVLRALPHLRDYVDGTLD